ncbi:MAG: HAMP domain-containing sensor histidine kinase [Sulfurovum sp.]|nr:HAMP domain-containing sensor histidine kinase [Sulfurovum sp.]
MSIRTFIILLYTAAGLLIAAISVFATFVIIDTPIGMKMLSEIVVTVVAVLPVVIVISYLFGRYLITLFEDIQGRLSSIRSDGFKCHTPKAFLNEIESIHCDIDILEERINSLLDESRRQNETLRKLLISLAHDIKTPLTVIKGYVEEMEDGLVSPDHYEEVYIKIGKELDFLDEIGVDILTFIGSTEGESERSVLKLKNFIDEEVIPLLPESKGMFYINTVDEEMKINFNRVDLKKLLFNLLNNALKYATSNMVRIYNREDTICFENEAAPIPEALHEKIFEPFVTVEESKNRRLSGFGLGLSIVRNLASRNRYSCTLLQSDIKKTVFALKPVYREEIA